MVLLIQHTVYLTNTFFINSDPAKTTVTIGVVLNLICIRKTESR